MTAAAIFAASIAKADAARRYTAASVSPLIANYTGRHTVPGTGTDARPIIQARLNAASSLTGPDWYSYLTRRSTAVTLPPGQYYLSAPSGGSPSLIVPAGVHLDTHLAQLYFDYPATPTASWCGIRVDQFASLRIGFMAPSAKNSPPDGTYFYDGVRLLGNDNAGTCVTGYADSEIRGFQGASIRGIGSWVTYVKGIRLTSEFGYVASSWPASNIYGYTQPGDMVPGPARGHNDIYLQDVYFNENRQGGFRGTVNGTPVNPHNLDYTSGALQAYFTNCIWEYFNNSAIVATGYVIGLTDCAFEEVGGDAGMATFDTVRHLKINGLRVNYTGQAVPAPGGGTASPSNPYVFNLASVQTFEMSGGYVHNSFLDTMTLASAAAGGYHVGPTFTDSYPLAPGPMYASRMNTHLSGTWNGGHLMLGAHHLWVDSGNVLRHGATAPTSETDGAAV